MDKNKIIYSSSDPTNEDGKPGDIWVKAETPSERMDATVVRIEKRIQESIDYTEIATKRMEEHTKKIGNYGDTVSNNIKKTQKELNEAFDKQSFWFSISLIGLILYSIGLFARLIFR